MTTDKERISLYIDAELKTKLKALAKKRKRSINSLTEVLYEEAIEKAIKKGEIDA